MATYTRRDFIKLAGTVGAALYFLGPSGCGKTVRGGKRVIVLGFDGMDPNLVRMLTGRGELPNISRLVRNNTTLELGTSTPPQSPVAWADFISGANPGYHGIFDFIQRDPETYLPYFSMSEAYGPAKQLDIGNHIIPLSKSGMRLLRKGEAFWNILEEKGIPCTVHRVPSNFPPQQSKAKTFSGMGTPDLRGGYGSFSYFTTDAAESKPGVTGGTINVVSMSGGKFTAKLIGPNNQFEKDAPPVAIPFTAYADASGSAARIDVSGKTIILKPGEWSSWTRLEFPSAPMVPSTRGIALFHLKEIKPHFRLYVSPINVDPLDPAVPISTPAGRSADLARKFGLFYTTGIPEDTKAFDNGVLTDGEYIHQAGIHHEEQRHIFHDMLKNHKSGLMFFYFSDTDLGSHMFWSAMDKNHPQYAKRDPRYRDTIFDYYRALDRVVGNVVSGLGADDTLLIVSDHGFSPFSWAFHANTWLKNHGFATLQPGAGASEELLAGVDWSGTGAYALGFNAMYINQSGREKNGNVSPGPEKDRLLDRISAELLAHIDPATGLHPVSSVYRADKVYSGPNMQRSPDLVIGYNRGYRGSWETALGKFPAAEIELNKQKWSGDHCVDPIHVPGIVMSNRRIKAARPSLRDIPAAVLAEFGVSAPPWMQGKNIF